MGVSYETDPQNPLQWFREQLAAINRRFDGLEAAGRTAGNRGGVVVPNAAGATLASTLNLAAGVTMNASSMLSRSRGMVDMHLSLNLGNALAQYSRVCTLPAGFRPFAVGASTGNWECPAVQLNNQSGQGWQAGGFFINTADLGIYTLTAALPAGSILDVHLSFRAAA